jgi:hypothetical protein
MRVAAHATQSGKPLRTKKPAMSSTKRAELMVSALGLEPKTYRLKVRCSTN